MLNLKCREFVVGCKECFHTRNHKISFSTGKDKNSNNTAFWDVVVITTADFAQKHVFELQIESKRKRNELPLNLPIHVVADPPGPKIGMILIIHQAVVLQNRSKFTIDYRIESVTCN
jgi:hypothetical protein